MGLIKVKISPSQLGKNQQSLSAEVALSKSPYLSKKLLSQFGNTNYFQETFIEQDHFYSFLVVIL